MQIRFFGLCWTRKRWLTFLSRDFAALCREISSDFPGQQHRTRPFSLQYTKLKRRTQKDEVREENFRLHDLHKAAGFVCEEKGENNVGEVTRICITTLAWCSTCWHCIYFWAHVLRASRTLTSLSTRQKILSAILTSSHYDLLWWKNRAHWYSKHQPELWGYWTTSCQFAVCFQYVEQWNFGALGNLSIFFLFLLFIASQCPLPTFLLISLPLRRSVLLESLGLLWHMRPVICGSMFACTTFAGVRFSKQSDHMLKLCCDERKSGRKRNLGSKVAYMRTNGAKFIYEWFSFLSEQGMVLFSNPGLRMCFCNKTWIMP